VTAATVSDFTEHVGVPLGVALIGLAATLAAAAVSFSLGRWNDATARRREGYSAGTRELVAWVEYPYRIRRRTSDDLPVLSLLADLGHEHQENLRYRQTWIAAENRWVATVFTEVRSDLAAILGASCNDAWDSGPIRAAGDMTLGAWGPKDVELHLERFENAVGFRFGWRRIVAVVGFRPGAKPRPGRAD